MMHWLLRAEGLGYAIAALAFYGQGGFSWWLFAALILAPDLSMLGYLAGPRMGAICYNIVHATPLAWVLVLIGHFGGIWQSYAIGLILFAHIGIDRVLGYGLKHSTGFRDTHLGVIGSANTNS